MAHTPIRLGCGSPGLEQGTLMTPAPPSPNPPSSAPGRWSLISPAPVCGPGDDNLPAYVANGIIGLRVPPVPWHGSHAVLNGVAGVDPVAAVESVPRLPYPLGGDLAVNGLLLSDALPNVELLDQTYDFSCGELTSRFRFHAEGVTATVTAVTFASMVQPTVVAQVTTVEVDAPARLALTARVSPADLPGRITGRDQGVPGANQTTVDGSIEWVPSGDLSRAGIAYATSFQGPGDAERSFGQARVGPVRTTYEIDARPHQAYRLWQLTSLVPERAHPDPQRQATRLVALASREGGQRLREDSRRAWAELWRARPVLLGAGERWQAMADAAFFYLHTSVHPASLASTNIFGLAQWHGYHYYYGHVMWDIEGFVVPPLLLTQPDAVRPMLQYRYRSLDAARYNAVLWGYHGAQYPWQSGPAVGSESAPELGDAAMYEHHVSMGVAHAFAQYHRATGDEHFLRDFGWPVVSGVAEWITSRVTRTGRGYEIKRAMGIAERTDPSDNVAYVNMAARVALDDAVAAARRLGRAVPRRWDEIRRGLVLPMDGDVILDHDGYTPDVEKGATPAALCGLFPLGYPVPPEVYEATVRYWLAMADDYIGAPMLPGLYGAWAATIGERKASLELFEEGYARYVSPRFMTTHEYRPDKFPDQPVAGPFMANIGAFLTACLYGLTGLRIDDPDPASWPSRPVIMPEGWDGIEVERVFTSTGPARLIAHHGDDRARLEPLDR